MSAVQSWTRLPKVRHTRILHAASRLDVLPALDAGETLIPHGNGRSYSDVALNNGGAVLKTRRLDHLMAFDPQSGRITCEGGVLLAEILDLVVPQGWTLPVVPGTRFVTLGGAIANDVHGKNHHVAGTFGHHVVRFELLRSDGSRMICSAQENADWFAATVGGLGLTGLITWAEISLQRIANPFMLTQATRFATLDTFWQLDAHAEADWPYTVSWIDCLAKSGRGILFTGRHAPAQHDLPAWRERKKSMPLETPVSFVNGLSLRLFNAAYYGQPLKSGTQLTHYVPYFFPLDAIGNWNRIYGRSGFYQYQCVVPPDGHAAIADMLAIIARHGQGSFLAVLKSFGDRPSPGMLSFARPGVTLALDFPNHGEATLKLFAELDAVVAQAGGALYPAKDSRIPADMFRRGFPQWEAFANFIDPKFRSAFWRRVGESS